MVYSIVKRNALWKYLGLIALGKHYNLIFPLWDNVWLRIFGLFRHCETAGDGREETV